MKLVLFYSRWICNNFLLEPLRDEVKLRSICDMQGGCTILQVGSNIVWFSLILSLCGFQIKVLFIVY